MYSVSVDFGSGAVDVSAYLVGQYPIKRTRPLHNGLKPVIGTCKFALNRDVTIINQFLTASTDPTVTVLKDGAAYFAGTIRRTVKVSVGTVRVDAIECECVDLLYRMDARKIRTSFVWTNYKISDPTTKTASILHQLFYLAGYSDAELNLSAISTTVDKFAVDGTSKSVDIRKLIEDVLRDAVYTLRVTESGIIELYDLFPASYSPSVTLSTGAGGNIADGYSLQRDEYKAEAVDVKYWTHKTIADAVVFEDTTGATAALPCSIPLAAGEYYPTGATSTASVRCKFELQDYEIVAVDSPAIEWAHTGDVVKQVETVDGLGILTRFYSATGGVITKLKITGSATVKQDECKVSSEIVASSDEREEIASEIIYTQAGAERIADGRAAWHKYATFKYQFQKITMAAMSDETLYPDTDLFPDPALFPWGDILRPGQIVALSDAVLLNASATLRILQVTDGSDPKSFAIICEGVGDYTPAATAGTPAITLPQVPRMFPAQKPLTADPAGATPDTADFVGQYGVYAGQRYTCTALPDTWALDDAGQTAAQVVAAVPVYVPRYLGPVLDGVPASAKEGDVYLLYSATPNTVIPPMLADPPDHRGVFRYTDSAWEWTTDPGDIYKALTDIVFICQLKDPDGAALYGAEADYGITSTMETAHIMAAIIDRLRVGDLEIFGTLKSLLMDTVNSQAGETISAPTPTYWPGSSLITLCSTLADGWHAVDSASTLDSKNITHAVKGGSDNTVSYQSDDTEITNNHVVKSITSAIDGKVRIYIDALSGWLNIKVNGVLVYNHICSIATYTSYYIDTYVAIGDTITLQTGNPSYSWRVKNFRVCPTPNTIGLWNNTDNTALSVDNAGYYDEAGTVNINSGTLTTASIDDYWLGSELISLFSGKIAVYREIDLEGGTFNSKTCATIYKNGSTSITLGFTDATTLFISATGYYSYTGSIILDDVEGKILFGDETAEGQYELWSHNIPGSTDNILTVRNIKTGKVFSIWETRAPDTTAGNDSESTLSLHGVVGTDDYVHDHSMHNYAGDMHFIDGFYNYGGDYVGEWKKVAKRTLTAWQESTAYVVGDYVQNGGNAYLCTYAGTSASSGGPSGTDAYIGDGEYGSACFWRYVGPVSSNVWEHLLSQMYSASGRLWLAGGRKPTIILHGALTEDQIYVAVAPYGKENNAMLIASGMIDSLTVSYVLVGFNGITFYGISGGTATNIYCVRGVSTSHTLSVAM